MSFCRKVSAAFTTTAGGAATVYTDDVVTGRILSVRYEYADADTGADITITTEDTGQAVLTLTNAGTSTVQKQPRQATHDVTGGAETYDATEPVNDYIWAVNERLKVVVAQGGNTKTGTLVFIVG